jgi:hypothetical protein
VPTATPDDRAHDLLRLVETLDHYAVEYLVVGGAAAIAYGAARLTAEAGCVVRRTRDNLARLAGALTQLGGRLRVAGLSDDEAKQLPVQIDATMLETAGVTTWMTDAGPLDVLAGLAASDGRLVPYEELVVRANDLWGHGFAVRVASLEDVVTAKEHAGEPRDLEALPELRRIRDNAG